jgi:arylamine N-acetyltransferase
MLPEKPMYTDSQVYRYLERINFPISQSRLLPPATPETLQQLVACHLHAIPFENLSLHYSTDRTIPLDPEFLFDKFVNQRKGGYCMEQNRAFSTLLHSLKFQSYNIGARVVLGDQLCGFNHMAIVVTLDDIEYLVDVGFGGNGLTAPLPIFNGKIIEEPISGVIPEEHRVHLDEFPGSTRKDHKIWMYQHRRNREAEWQTQFVFEKDFEFYSADYEV